MIDKVYDWQTKINTMWKAARLNIMSINIDLKPPTTELKLLIDTRSNEWPETPLPLLTGFPVLETLESLFESLKVRFFINLGDPKFAARLLKFVIGKMIVLLWL